MQDLGIRVRKRWSRALALLTAAALGVAGALILPTAAYATDGEVSGMTVSVEQDGTEPFTDSEGLDDGPNNGVVMANDQVKYLFNVNYTNLGDVPFTATLPQGARWHTSAAATSIWNGPGGAKISADGRTLTGIRAAESAAEDFSLIVWVFGFGNGTEFAPSFTYGGTTETAPSVEVKAAPKTQTKIRVSSNGGTATHDGVSGISFVASVSLGAETTDVRGYEALGPSFTFMFDVPEGAVVTQAQSGAGIGGTVTFEQDGPGQPVTLTVTGGETSFVNASLAVHSGNWRPAGTRPTTGVVSFNGFVPYDPYLPSNEITSIEVFKLHGFDPLSLSEESNFGDGFANGQDPTYVCPAVLSKAEGLACQRLEIDRTNDYLIRPFTRHGTSYPGNGMLTGDNQTYIANSENILPGQKFSVLNPFGNGITANETATNPYVCTVFDNELLTIVDPSRLLAGGNGATNTRTPLPESQRALEYTNRIFATDDERRDFNCGIAGDGDEHWFSNTEVVPGGKEAVTGVRASTEHFALEPGKSVALQLSLQRTTTAKSLALELRETMPWFFSYGTAETGPVLSNYPINAGMGGDVQAADVLVRHRAKLSSSSASPGDLRTLTISPVVSGAAVSGIDNVAKNVQIRVDFSNTTFNPVIATLEALDIDYELTPADPGIDGVLGTEDDGLPASVLFNLGDLGAPGGEPGFFFNAGGGGHETILPPITFQVENSALAQNATTHSISSVISADNDHTVAQFGANGAANKLDRTEYEFLVINGVAGFQTGKDAVTAENGRVAPGEEFSYTINWGNASSEPVGEATFVDVLPFDGDQRGTTGLGAAGLELISASASMQNPSIMGDVLVEYTTDDSASVETAIVAGNEDGSVGVYWQSGTIPSDATALRFSTAQALSPGYSGSATITVKAPAIAAEGMLKNDVWGRTAPVDANINTVKLVQGVALHELLSSASSVEGTVWRDLNFDGLIDKLGPDVTWPESALPAVPVTVELAPVGVGTTFTVPVGVNGEYRADVAPGEYEVRLTGGASSDWNKQLPANTITVALGDQLVDQDLLYQETVAAAALVDDTARVGAGATTQIDVTANDSLGFPATPGSVYSANGVALGSTAPSYGTVSIVGPAMPTAPALPSEQSQIKYVASAGWPPAFDGQTTYADTFTYTWTNAVGDVQTATVTVTVVNPPTGTDVSATIPIGGSATLDAGVVGEGITVGAVTDVPAGATNASVTADGKLSFSAGTAVPGAYPMTAVFTDELGQSVTITYTVTIQGGPTGADQSATIAMGASVNLDAEIAGIGVTAGAPTGVPTGASATVDAAGVLTFDAGTAVAGTHVVSVEFTDDLNQTSTANYSITLQALPTALGGTAVIGVGGTHSFDASPAADPAVSTASIDQAEVTTPPMGSGSGSGSGIAAAGDATVEVDGTVEFDAGAAAPGTYTFETTFTDNLGQIVTVPFTVTVQANIVVTGATSALIGEGQTALFNMAIDTTGSVATAELTATPSAGSVTANVDGSVAFASGAAEPGVYTFEVTFTDDLGQRTVISFTVTVQEMIRVQDQSGKVAVGGTLTFTEQVATTGAFTRQITSHPTEGTASLGSVIFDAGTAEPGVYDIEVTYTDNVNQVAVATYTVTVQAPPEGEGKTVHTDSDTVKLPFDPQGDTTGTNLQDLTDADLTQPSHGTVAVVDGAVVYTPQPGYSGSTSFTVSVSDDLGQSVLLTYGVEIELPAAALGGSSENPGLNGTLEVTGGDPATRALLLGASLAMIVLGGLAVVIAVRMRRAQDNL